MNQQQKQYIQNHLEIEKRIKEEIEHVKKTLLLPQHMVDVFKLGMKRGATIALTTRQ